MAGLKIFFPKPPNSDFAKNVPNEAPIMTTHNGTVGGMVRVKMSGVMIKLKSKFFFLVLAKRNSTKPLDSVATKAIHRLCMPKITIDAHNKMTNAEAKISKLRLDKTSKCLDVCV